MATKQCRAVNDTQKKPEHSLFHPMHAFAEETYLTSALSFSVSVLLSITANRAVYGMNSLQNHCCLVALKSLFP